LQIINLALDAAWRFARMPREFSRDWLRVAGEEPLHFGMLREHLRTLGDAYGDFDADDRLWAMAERTAGDVVARMALVLRTLEARLLDATPPLQAKRARHSLWSRVARQASAMANSTRSNAGPVDLAIRHGASMK